MSIVSCTMLLSEYLVFQRQLSAAIERVFSQGGLIAVPHRVGMTDKTLSSLIFLKCNFNMNL
jgi:hypothetical protein